MLKNKKVISLLAVVLVIIIIGLIMLFVKGLNYGLMYGKNTTVELYLKTDFEFSDVKNIITEIFGNKVKTRHVNNLDYDILIITKEAQDEKLESLVSKINEKYSLDLKKDDLLVTNNANVGIIDLISPYILPVCLTSIMILAYFIIRYKSIGIFNISVYTILTIILVQLLLLSVYAIARIPINEYTMPASLVLYLASVMGLTEIFESSMKKIKEEEIKNKKSKKK